MRKQIIVTICILLLIFSIGCASLIPHPRAWTKKEKIAAGFFIAAHTANAFTTEAHQNHPELYYEMNPIMGRHPSDTEIVTYFSVTGAATLLLTHFYPELRKPLLYGYGTVNSYWVVHDIQMMNRD